MATNTAASFTNHTGNGSAGPFNISFSYLSEAEVDVTVGGVLKTITTHYTFTSATQITFTSGNEPGNGVAIKFQRDTNISAKKVDFADGSVLTEADLDANSDQVLFAQQEIIDKLGGIEEGATGDQTNAEIRTAVEAATDSNVFTDADHSKLNAIEASATADQTAAEIRTLVESASDSNVFTDADHTKLNGIEASATADQTASEIRTLVESASDSNVFTDADHTKLNAIEAGATADQTISEIKSLIAGSPLDATHLAANSVDSSELVDGSVDTSHLSADCVDGTKIADNAIGSEHLQANSVTTSEIADAELSTLAGMQSGTASKLADSTALTADIADLNQIDGMAKQTTITNSDNHFPTSGAVVDFVANQIAPVGGLEVIPDEDSFPSTQPVSGVVISITNADGLIINSSGVATNARTLGNGSDNVTINNFPASLRSKTLSPNLGLLVSSTGASQTYNYHKLLAKEEDVLQLSDDINDFNARYRVVSSNPTSDNDAGDLIFNTSTSKLLVYNATSGAFEEAQSIGNFFISTFSESFDGSRTDFTVSNAPANAQQIILSINGVVQKPNAGSSVPSEGFALSGNTVKLSSAPASGSDVFIIVMGSTVNVGTPSNNTVSSAILQNGSVIEAKLGSGAVTRTKLSLISTSSVAGLEVKGDGSSDGYLQLNCSQNSHGIKLKSPPHSAGASYTFTFPQNIQNGQFLTTDANGNTSWSAVVTDLVNDTSPQLGGNLASNGNNIDMADNDKIQLGTGTDFEIYHKSADNSNYIESENGRSLFLQQNQIYILNEAGNEYMIHGAADGAVSIYHNNSKKFETLTDGTKVTGTLRFDTSDTAITLADDKKIKFGNSDDLKIYHDGSSSLIQSPSHPLAYYSNTRHHFLNGDGSENMAVFVANGSCDLYYDNSKKFETTSEGIGVTGVIDAGGTYTSVSHTLDNSSLYSWSTKFRNHASGYGIDVRVHDDSASREGFHLYSTNAGQSKAAIFMNGTYDSRNNDYGAFSDIKLKENIVDAKSQWDDIKAVKFRNFNFKDNPSKKMLGVVAQELELVSAGLVEDIPDKKENSEGDRVETGEVTKHVRYSVLYMKAIKALQEAMVKIETLETKVAALEAG